MFVILCRIRYSVRAFSSRFAFSLDHQKVERALAPASSLLLSWLKPMPTFRNASAASQAVIHHHPACSEAEAAPDPDTYANNCRTKHRTPQQQRQRLLRLPDPGKNHTCLPPPPTCTYSITARSCFWELFTYCAISPNFAHLERNMHHRF